MKKLFLLIVLFAGMGVMSLSAQTKVITGTVTPANESDGEMIGVSVSVKGTTIGTITDLDGKYSLPNVPSNATTLIFSFIGMKTAEVEIGGRTVVDCVLESEAVGLDEIVVTAMGISREKKALGYAVQDIKSDELTKASNSNFATALQGKVSGIEVSTSSGMPGASSKVTIRGSRSFTGNNQPLYVIDGMPVASTSDQSTGNSVTGSDYASRSLDIDPNDIESINVLKGQAASALYGMRASNGVVVITTKSGKGMQIGKPVITFNSSYSVEDMSIRPELQSEFAQGGLNRFGVPTYSTPSSLSWGPKISELPNSATYGGNVVNAYTNALGLHEGKYYVPQRAAAGLDPWATPQAYDNVDAFFQKGFTSNNSINVAQNFEKANYSFTIGNTKSEGIVPSTGLDKINAKFLAEVKLDNHFSTGFAGNYVVSDLTKQSGANNGIVATVFPAPASYDLAGIPSYVEGDPYTQNNYRAGTFDHAFWAIDNNLFAERNQRFFGNAFLKYTTILSSDQTLDLKYQLGADAYSTEYKDSWGWGSGVNRKGEITEQTYTSNEINSLFTAAYNWKINSGMVLDVLVGNEIVDSKNKYVEAYGANYNFSGWNHLNNATLYSSNSGSSKYRSIGTFGSVSFAYNSMVYATITGRNDIVSSMPHGNRSFFYPSVALGWIFTELEGLQNNILTYGKLRLSYAEVGQAGSYYDSFYEVPVYGGGFSSGTPILYPIDGTVAYTPSSTVYDPNLVPQNTKAYEIGADFALFEGLIDFNYTFSRQNVVDQIFSVPLAGSTGYTSYVTNGGSIHTNAHEFTLAVNPVSNRNFTWDFAFNFSKIDNYVDELAEGVESIFLGGFTEPQVRAGIGDKFPVIYGVGYARTDDGKYIVDGDGFPVSGEEQVIGTVSPDFQLGFNNNFTIYKFNISATLDWKKGGQMYYATAGMLDYYGASQKSADYRNDEDGWIFKEGESVKITGYDGAGNPEYADNDIVVPKEYAYYFFDADNNVSESMIYDASFIKLRELSISYPVLTKSKLNLNVSLYARNLLLYTAIPGFDPEVSQGNTNMSGAFERFSLPNTKSFGLGINLKF